MNEFPLAPKTAVRIRPLIWVCVNCDVGRVRVFADFPDGSTERIYNGKPCDREDKVLDDELAAALSFYGIRSSAATRRTSCA